METTLSIQQVAELTELSIDTLRYYERIGLLEKVDRASSGHRRYQQKDIEWIRLLINLKETGMPLAQMIHFAELRRQGDATATERLLLLEQHQQSLEQQMRKLEQHMIELQQKITHKKAFLAQRDAASQAAHAVEQSEAAVEHVDSEAHVNLNTQEEKESFHGWK
jgi:DNA-binding transcriptional MerR regulator